MQGKFENHHELWVEKVFAMPEWEGGLIFGLSDPCKGGDTKPILVDQIRSEKFEKQFIQFCHKFGFTVESPYVHSTSLLAKTDRIGYEVAEQLIITLKTIRDYRQVLNMKLADRKARNEKTKPGPLKTPCFFAEMILVGIRLHRESDTGTKLLRAFLEPKGKLDEWLTKNSFSKDFVQTLIVATGNGGEIGEWTSKKKQTMERIVLSWELGKEVKIVGDYKSELSSLRERISRRAETILK